MAEFSNICEANKRGDEHCWHNVFGRTGSYSVCCWCGKRKGNTNKPLPEHGPHAPLEP